MTTTRFAPSPTGYIHIGNLRTALMNYLIARKAGGTFILRIDDTDPERSKEDYVDAIKEDLDWLGLHWDRVERQSERLDRYHAAAVRLREMGRLYEAFETPTELDLKRKKQLNMGKPPVYDRAALALGQAEKEALRAERGNGVWRFKLDLTRDHYPHLHEVKPGILAGLGYNGRGVAIATAMGRELAHWAAGADPAHLNYPTSPITPLPFSFARETLVEAEILRLRLLDKLGL